MKNTIQKTTPGLLKIIILFSFLLIAFTVGDGRSEYLVPTAAASVYSTDLDLDGNIDIVTGHHYNSTFLWGGMAFLNNIGNGYFHFTDSLFTGWGVLDVCGDFFDNNSFIDIYTRLQTDDPYTDNILIIYNYGDTKFDSIKQFYLYNDRPINSYSSSDVNGNGHNDIVFSCNNDFFWGIIYNDGIGNFSDPEYYDLDFPPIDIKCADLNNDGRSDVVVSGSDTEIYFSNETGFQQQLLTETRGHDVLISDFDNDNDNDIILETTFVSNHHRVYMFENIGHNDFLEHDYFDFTPFCQYAQIADINNDSLPDMVFLAHNNSGLYIYNNIGDFNLEYQQFIPINSGVSYTKQLTLDDFDNNGYNDLGVVLYNHYQIPVNLILLFNDGKGNFVEDPVGINETPVLQYQTQSLQCYPNPFSEYLNFKFSIIKQNSVDLSVYDINGNHIKTIMNKIYSPGKYKLKWNGKCKNGKEVKPGAYLIRLKTGNQIQTERVILIK